MNVSNQSLALEVSGLTKAHGGSSESTGVFDLSFSVGRGEVVGLLGPNGSGKSTTLHCITGIIESDAGSIKMAGIPHRRAEAKNQFGFLPDDLPMPNSLTMAEVRVLHRRLRPRFDDAFAGELVEMVGLAVHSRKYVSEFSHGMKRKLQLVTALAHRPPLLILDEPMRGLDPEAAILLRGVMDTFVRQSGSIFLATHDLESAEKNCDRVVVLSKGRMIADGSPAQLMNTMGASSLEDYFVRATGLEERVGELQRTVQRMTFINEERVMESTPKPPDQAISN